MNNNLPRIDTLEAEQELNAFELENSRPAVVGFPKLTKIDPNISPDFKEFDDTQESKIRQEFYSNQERPKSSIHTRLCDLRDKLNSKQDSLKSQLKQVKEQLKQVHKQLDRLSKNSPTN